MSTKKKLIKIAGVSISILCMVISIVLFSIYSSGIADLKTPAFALLYGGTGLIFCVNIFLPPFGWKGKDKKESVQDVNDSTNNDNV